MVEPVINDYAEVEDEHVIWEYKGEENDDSLEDEKSKLDIPAGGLIIAFSETTFKNPGYGSQLYYNVAGYHLIRSGNIKDCLDRKDEQLLSCAVDGNGDFTGVWRFPNGRKECVYRAVRQDVSEEDVEELLQKVYENCVTDVDISRVTRRLGDDISRAYGWELPEKPVKITLKRSGVQEYVNGANRGQEPMEPKR